MRTIFAILLFYMNAACFAQQALDTMLLSDDERQTVTRLEGYRQRVLKGESFSGIATLYTEDPGSAKTGGAYYGITKGMFVPEFEEAAWALQKPGDISEVFKTNYGFHFVQLIAKHGEAVDIRHILIKTNAK